jgi:Raf kinase inhibitor-like YbhB/YbcL family protein
MRQAGNDGGPLWAAAWRYARRVIDHRAMAFKLRSPTIAPGGPIPAKYTCDGANVSPPLRWTDPPSNTKGFVVIVDDHDVSGGTAVHWLLYGVAASRRELPEGLPALDTVENIGTQGTNGFGNVGYGGPCPPPGSSHHYVFTLYSLDASLVVPPRTVKLGVLRAMHGHVLGQAHLVGRYSRNDPGGGPKRGGVNAPALIDESATSSLPIALNDAMYLIGELTNDDISTRVLAEINLKFARIEEIVSAVRFNRQQEGWAFRNPRALQLVDEHIGMLDLLILECRARPSVLQRLEAARAVLVAHRQRIEHG